MQYRLALVHHEQRIDIQPLGEVRQFTGAPELAGILDIKILARLRRGSQLARLNVDVVRLIRPARLNGCNEEEGYKDDPDPSDIHLHPLAKRETEGKRYDPS